MPKRIQIKRQNGSRTPPNTVWVARPSKWGNPFRGESAIEKYREWLIGRDLSELRGKNLACHCRLHQACHADVLLKLANE